MELMYKTFTVLTDTIKCHFCKRISHNVNDIKNRFCANCTHHHAPIGQNPIPFTEGVTEYDKPFLDSPDCGSPECLCSRCALPIATGAVRMWPNEKNIEYRFHGECVGFQTNSDLDDEDD
jgi:hypothetical protein